jgi:hypothetical protein
MLSLINTENPRQFGALVGYVIREWVTERLNDIK